MDWNHALHVKCAKVINGNEKALKKRKSRRKCNFVTCEKLKKRKNFFLLSFEFFVSVCGKCTHNKCEICETNMNGTCRTYRNFSHNI